MDRSSRPKRLYRPTPAVIVEQVEVLRRQRFTGKQIGSDLGVSPATVSRILRRLGLIRMRDLEPVEPVCRYEREQPGDMISLIVLYFIGIDGAARGIRTPDPVITNDVLYQLSYCGNRTRAWRGGEVASP